MGDLTRLLRDIGLAAKIVSREVNRAGIANISGVADKGPNASGEKVQKLDILADDMLISCLQNSGEVCGIASEENDNFVTIKSVGGRDAKYIVIFDPLDGSSNIDVSITIGTIFGIYRRLSDTGPVTLEDFLQKGTEQVAAGYIVYGSSTMMVYTTGKGVNGFTLDPSIGEFCLSHPNIRIPDSGTVYSTNQGHYLKYPEGVRRYIDYCVENAMTLRYVGSMVADVHRNLLKGGIFFYPPTKSSPKGKLRLLYECNPLAFIVEQAGGMATDGRNRILELQPTELHERTPVYIGSKSMVEKVKLFLDLKPA
jgi:fructose-1,6-bisphosphatase I